MIHMNATAKIRKINDIAKSASQRACEADLVARLDYCANGKDGKDGKDGNNVIHL